MDRKKRQPSGTTSSEDTVFVRIVAKWLSPDSLEFQARANRPLSERGPNLARYHEEERAKAAEQPKSEGDKPTP